MCNGICLVPTATYQMIINYLSTTNRSTVTLHKLIPKLVNNIHRRTNNLEGVAIAMKDLKKQLKIKAMDHRMEIRPMTYTCSCSYILKVNMQL